MDDQESLHPAIRALKTVCRCNNIKYRTIERAIREGAHSVAAVASRTLATTGYCGGTCTPDIQAMLDELAPGAGMNCPPKPKSEALPDPKAWWLKKK
jgi:NAD(P)H-nitrite reductase large subunit